MSICCTVCGQWYATEARDTLDVCPPCWRQNFAGNLLEAPSAREVLEAYVDSSAQMTPRQLEVLRRATLRWAWEQEEHHD